MKGHERERQFFEMQVESVISSAIDNLSSDLDLYEGTLALSFHQSVDECAAEHGIENGNDLITALDWGAIEPRIANDSDYELDNLLQLRHDCAVHASSYPTLSEALRNDLISRTESALLESVLKWTREHPELVVPMEYHTGANHPYADQLAEACRGSSNPSACAENAGIDLESDTPDNGQNRGE
ncbi:hypothetical protein [Candidatus Poriferisodalis sp.]|uniref:hypothetical protein n=1 Tax=Candidatus Poriferisodalis sp. TaxID=3101277 RepID=UPI003B5BF630